MLEHQEDLELAKLEGIDNRNFTFMYKGKKYEIQDLREDYGGIDNRPHMLEEVKLQFGQGEFSLFELRLTNALGTGIYKELKNEKNTKH